MWRESWSRKRERQILSDSCVKLYLEDKGDLGVRAGTAAEQVTLSVRVALRTGKKRDFERIKGRKDSKRQLLVPVRQKEGRPGAEGTPSQRLWQRTPQRRDRDPSAQMPQFQSRGGTGVTNGNEGE